MNFAGLRLEPIVQILTLMCPLYLKTLIPACNRLLPLVGAFNGHAVLVNQFSPVPLRVVPDERRFWPQRLFHGFHPWLK